ncbi:hypothetical protein [Phaeodactylibacter xiamenensis]|jgi:hypothetical protein|uniref:Uncharacterized protein n=2 Tax=Phaeodactylibacter TaxID=1564515 RepID=A0A098S2Q8_9BACT|nr:hypothetical protein [Phaeodactylibacter xiamenensis]KGE86410.1 hypothetical protein IX84_21715 [Phaeodactylibacter xiamenensis]MCR9054519.1 hypothetical protein [bacterium]
MTITIQTADKEALAKVLNLLKTLGINSVNVQLEPSTASESYIKGDKSIDPTSLFGIWSKHPKTLEQVRATAWDRKFEQ